MSATSVLPGPRLISAEILKVRKRRGLMIACGLITVGIIVLVNVVLIVLHAVNPDNHGPAGGLSNFGGSTGAVGHLGSVVAILIGATAGAGDLNAGVFRELVVTGRSRLALFLARIPGGLAVLWGFVLVAYVITAIVGVAFAGSLAKPSLGVIVEGALWLLLSTGFYFVLALGFASLVGSRSTAIGALLAFRLLVAPILVSIAFLGGARKAVPIAPLDRLAPAQIAGNLRQGPELHLPVATAILVLLLWTVISLGIGAWRTQTRDA
jgi:ABC-type transport system involved in multi-copper enzyme maturation permease subunit